MIEAETVLICCVNRSNDMVIIDYNMNQVRKIEGLPGLNYLGMGIRPTISESGRKKLLALWLRGNNQAVLLDIKTMEELDRAPLFGTGDNYKTVIPVCCAYSSDSWCGVYIQQQEPYIVWIVNGESKEIAQVSRLIPEGKMIYQLYLSPGADYIVALFGTDKRIETSRLFLVVLKFGGKFKLMDFKRLDQLPRGYVPTLHKNYSGTLFAVNCGQRILLYTLSAEGTLKSTVDIPSGKQGRCR
mgnify:CR=1 FL=1